MMNTRQVIWPIDDSLKSFIIEAITVALASTMAVVNKTIEDQVNKSIAAMNSSVNECITVSRVNVENVTCEVYVEALLKRFCSTYEDPMSKLKNIRQKGGLVQLYIDAFNLLMTKVEVSETQAISFFLGGLDKEIEMSVRMFRPQTLVDACLSKLQVANNNVSKRYVLGHKCSGKLFSLEIVKEIEELENESELHGMSASRRSSMCVVDGSNSGGDGISDGWWVGGDATINQISAAL
ncbi:reverse transcriptase [Tanacetum coccineum]